MRAALLINPNSTAATTAMMVAIAQATAAGLQVDGATATRAPPMITEPEALRAASAEVVEIALANQGRYDGMVVAAFGDPGLEELRARCAVPAVGLGESAMAEAASGGRRFGIATTTPALAAQIEARAVHLGLAQNYTGIRITRGDPASLMANPLRLQDALAEAAGRCIRLDGAEAVIIGGGPLGHAASRLQPMFRVPVIAPIPAAMRRLAVMLGPDAHASGWNSVDVRCYTTGPAP